MDSPRVRCPTNHRQPRSRGWCRCTADSCARRAAQTGARLLVSDATSERARQLSVEKRWSQEAPVDGARSRRLSGTVYGLRILPLPLRTPPGSSASIASKPAILAKIMHRRPAADLSDRGPIFAAMHAVDGADCIQNPRNSACACGSPRRGNANAARVARGHAAGQRTYGRRTVHCARSRYVVAAARRLLLGSGDLDGYGCAMDWQRLRRAAHRWRH